MAERIVTTEIAKTSNTGFKEEAVAPSMARTALTQVETGLSKRRSSTLLTHQAAGLTTTRTTDTTSMMATARTTLD
jgi:hypothetical protein